MEQQQKSVRLSILMPGRVVADEAFDAVTLRTSEGELGILPGHVPCALVLRSGLIRCLRGGETVAVYATLGGFASMEGDRLTVLSAVAEHPDRLEEALASIERAREEVRVQERRSDAESHRMETALRRTLVRNDISAFSILRDNSVSAQEPEQEEGL